MDPVPVPVDSFVTEAAAAAAKVVTPGARAAREWRESGNKKISHYEVQNLVGYGGMGVVFKAQDTKLDRAVALKLLPSEWGQDDRAKQRFMQEARAAGSMDHPNVCTVYEVNETDEGQLYMSMPFYEGETLRSKIEKGPMAAGEAAAIAAQVATGLAEAHSRGIVHRDIKPANLLITSAGVVKILDFGLAKLAHGPRLTEEASTLGTIAYMSPEQSRGAGIDARSDVWALGVVLFEMLSGKHPLERERVDATIHSIRTDHPEPLGDEVPRALREVVAKALAKTVGDRYQSAREMAEALEVVRQMLRMEGRALAESAVGASDARLKVPERFAWRARRILWGTMTIVALLGIVAILGTGVKVGRRPVPEGSLIVLGEVRNLTSDPELDVMGLLLESELRQSTRVTLMDRATVRQVLGRMMRSPTSKLQAELAREIAWREGAVAVVGGELRKVGSQFVLLVSVWGVGKESPAPTATWSQTFLASQKEHLHETIDEAGVWIRTQVGETRPEVQGYDVPSREATTPSWEALSLYLRAQRLSYEGEEDEALLLYEEAIEEDADFVMAWVRLGDILRTREEEEAFYYWQKALQILERRRVTKWEELRIRALYLNDTGDFERAEEHFRRFVAHYPNNYYPLFGHAMTLMEMGRMPEAIERFQQAEAKNPTLQYAPIRLGMLYLELARFEEARAYARRLEGLGLDEWSESILGATAFLEGDYEKAGEIFDGLILSSEPDWQSAGLAAKASLMAELGRWTEAVDLLEKSIQVDAIQGRTARRAGKLVALAYVLSHQDNELDRLREACLEAWALEKGPRHGALATMVLARAGLVEEARVVLADLESSPELPVYDVARLRARGELSLAEGRTEAALAEFGEASRLAPPREDRGYLARALWMAGRKEEALTHLREVVNNPGRVWRPYGGDELPGYWADTRDFHARVESTEKTVN